MATVVFKEGSAEASDLKLDIPFRSQRLDIDPHNEPHRACGMTCVWMALAGYGVPVIDLNELVAFGKERGGLLEGKGWDHRYLAATFQGYGISCERDEKMPIEESLRIFVEHIEGGDPILISVTRPEGGTHLILLTGIRKHNGVLSGFFYHDPDVYEREKGIHIYISIPDLVARWRQMAIMPKKPADWTEDRVVSRQPPDWRK